MDGHFNGKSNIEAYLISEEDMKAATDEGSDYSNDFYDKKGYRNETTKDLGKLSLSSTLKKVNRQSEMIPASDMILKQIQIQSKHNLVKQEVKQYQEYSDGVLKILINKIYNLPEPIDSQFEIEFKVKSKPLLELKGTG